LKDGAWKIARQRQRSCPPGDVGIRSGEGRLARLGGGNLRRNPPTIIVYRIWGVGTKKGGKRDEKVLPRGPG